MIIRVVEGKGGKDSAKASKPGFFNKLVWSHDELLVAGQRPRGSRYRDKPRRNAARNGSL
jgi:hypothetical protein